MQAQEDLEQCPSFNSYSFGGLADTATRVIRELNEFDGENSGFDCSLFIGSVDDGDSANYDADFEFVSLSKASDLAVFLDDPIGPIFPVFNRDTLSVDNAEEEVDDPYDDESSIRIPLEKLIIRDRDCDGERDPASSSSSSEADEMEAIPQETYCVWAPPKPAEPAVGKCKKSKSIGSSSKRWKFIDLLPRSNSDGRNSSVFLTPSSTSNSGRKEEIKAEIGESSNRKKSAGETKVGEKSKAKGNSRGKVASAHELFYTRNRMLKEEGKKEVLSSLPERPGWVLGHRPSLLVLYKKPRLIHNYFDTTNQ